MQRSGDGVTDFSLTGIHGATEQRSNGAIFKPASPFLRYSVAPCDCLRCLRPLRYLHRQRHLHAPDAVRSAADRRALSPCSARSRARTLARPKPVPVRRGRSGSHGFSTTIDSVAVPRDAAMRIVPPSSTCAMPCVTAFSTIGCSRSGGTRQPSAPSDTISTWSRLAEAHLLDFEEPPGQRQLPADRDAIARAEREAVAKEVGEQQAHPAGRRRIQRRQRADRVQAVEQEVRVDLRAQRSQLRFTRQHLHLQPPAFGLARLLERSEQVAHRERQQVQQQAEPENQRGLAREDARRVEAAAAADERRSSRGRAPATRRCSAPPRSGPSSRSASRRWPTAACSARRTTPTGRRTRR